MCEASYNTSLSDVRDGKEERMSKGKYDLIVIGSGPTGQRAAIQAAKLGKRAIVLEKKNVVGGVCINTGAIPSKTMRETAIYLSGYRLRDIYGSAYTVKSTITMQDLLFRSDFVVTHEIDVILHQLKRNGVEIVHGNSWFQDPHTVIVESIDGNSHLELYAEFVLIATGTHATRGSNIPFDGDRIFSSDDIIQMKRIPRTMVVIGAGVIGCEYASIFSTLGVQVTLIEKGQHLLPFVDHEISDSLVYHLRQNRVTMRLGEEVSNVVKTMTQDAEHIKIRLVSGKQVVADVALYSIGRTGNTAGLHLEAAGLSANERGRTEKFNTV